MGWNENSARRALVFTQNANVQVATNWILDHTNDADITAPVELVRPENLPSAKIFGSLGSSMMPSDAEIEWKVVLVVRRDLNMSVGKIAAQCAHAAVGIYKRLAQSSVANLQKWEKNGQKKVVVGVDSEQELMKLESQAVERNLPTSKVRDAGRTEVEPGTTTVLAVCGPSWQVDEVTGGLRILK